MNKNISTASVVFIILAVAGFVYLSAANNSTQPVQETSLNSTVESEDTTDTEEQGAVATETGKYVDYSENVMAQTSGTKLLFFHAPWCPQCRALEADIKEKGVPEGVTIIKVDYDTNQDLRKKYGVTIQTTFVKVDDQGNLVEKYTAYDDPTLEAVKENLL